MLNALLEDLTRSREIYGKDRERHAHSELYFLSPSDISLIQPLFIYKAHDAVHILPVLLKV